MPRIPTKKEYQFIDFLEAQGKTWTYEPVAFDTGIPCKKHNRNQYYIPDFYCPESDIYYEVSATRQAYHSSMKKIKQILKINPMIKIAVVKPNGNPYHRKPPPLKFVAKKKYD